MITSLASVPTLNGKWLWVKARLGLLTNRMLVVNSRLYGQVWKIPVVDGLGFGLAIGTTSEEWLYEEIARCHAEKKIDLFVDVGVNMGQTLLKVKSIDRNISYFGIEPNPTCVFYTDMLIEQNNLSHTSVSCFAVGNTNGVETLFFSGREDTRASMKKNANTPADLVKERKVSAVQIDDISFPVKAGSHVVLKIDVEGLEMEVIEGATDFISSYHPILFFECLPHLGDPESKERNRRVYDLLVKQGYQVYLLQREGGKILVEHAFDNETNYDLSDFLAIPSNSMQTYPK